MQKRRRNRGPVTWEELLSKSVPEPNSGCLLWLGTTARGYGWIGRGGKTLYAHRVSYELHSGPIPAGMQVMHKCDQRSCINPDHLRIGTPYENALEYSLRGRPKERRVRNAKFPPGVLRVRCKSPLFEARLYWHGQCLTLGYYPTPEEAGETVRARRGELIEAEYPGLV